MGSSLLRRLLAVSVILVVPAVVFAQEAALTGIVTDATMAVLPGVTIKAVHAASGNTFEAVTDQRGAYRIPVRVGVYKITATLSGFNTVTRDGVEILVGQTTTINLQMATGGVAESLTVTAQAPLIETTTSSLGSSIDPRQVTELPSQGRNWMSLALLAPGNRTNAQGVTPVQDRGDVREFQLNVDGLQVTSNLGTGNQSRYSNDAIAEFQFISNRFDATQGRSSGVQVNAITKSGGNNFAGSLVGNFRNSDWNAADPVLNKVVPYSNQQISGTTGGPIVKNKLHFFANYEYEHQPLTSIWQTPYPAFNVELQGIRDVKLAGVRVDHELNVEAAPDGEGEPLGSVRAVRAGHQQPSVWNQQQRRAFDRRRRTVHAGARQSRGERFQGGLRVLRNQPDRAHVLVEPLAGSRTASPLTARISRCGGFSTGRNNNLPRYRNQNVYTFHDDFTFSFDAAGRHDLKSGGEYLHLLDNTRNCNRCGGVITANNGPVPGQHRADPARSLQRRHLGAVAAVEDHDQLPGRRVGLVGVPDAAAALEIRRVGAGRLAALLQRDREPRPAVRPDLEFLRAERRLPAV